MLAYWPWRERGRPVVLVRHDSTDPVSPLYPSSPGNAFRPGAEGPHDLLVTKTVNSSFHGNSYLDAWLRASDVEAPVLCVSPSTTAAGPPHGSVATSATGCSSPCTANSRSSYGPPTSSSADLGACGD